MKKKRNKHAHVHGDSDAFTLVKKRARKKKRESDPRQSRPRTKRSLFATSQPGSVSRHRIQQQPALALNITPLRACDDT